MTVGENWYFCLLMSVYARYHWDIPPDVIVWEISFWISTYKCFFDLNINVTAPRSKYKPTWVFSRFRMIISLCFFYYQQRPFWRLFHGYRKQKQSKIWICITANVKLGSGRRRSWLEKLNISGNAKTLHKLNLQEFLFTLERIFKVLEMISK